MSFFLRIRNPIQLQITKLGSNPITHLKFIHNSISKPQQEPNQNHPSLTVSYLINSCGLSPQSALSAAEKINIKTNEKPDSVINALKSYGFTDTQIAKLIEKYPRILSSNPDKIIEPKLDFFLGVVGLSGTQLTELICLHPWLLRSSLENKLKPNFDLLTSVFDTNQQIAVAIRRTSWLLRGKLETNFLPNVRILRQCGVPGPNIAKFATLYPRVITRTTEQFKMTVELIRKLGFDPLSFVFGEGIYVMSGMSPSTWERKVVVYKSVGLSEGEIISAFKKKPNCMLSSEEKIRRSMDFFVKKMHWSPSFVAARPVLLRLSLEKRVKPRCSAMKVLASKGLVMNKSSIQFLLIGEKDFLTKYVTKYQDEVPEVLQAYNGNLSFKGLEGESAKV